MCRRPGLRQRTDADQLPITAVILSGILSTVDALGSQHKSNLILVDYRMVRMAIRGFEWKLHVHILC